MIGAPGSGKTTTCKHILNYMQKHSIQYVNMSGSRETPIYMKIFIKLCMLYVRMSPFYRALYKKINVIVAPYPRITVRGVFSNMDVLIWDVLRHVFAYRIFEKMNIYLLNDEGVLHKMLPLTLRHNVPITLLIDIYNMFNLNLELIYIKGDIEQIINNIKKRNRHDCALDEMGEQELKIYLTQYDTIVNMILAHQKNVTVYNSLEMKIDEILCNVVINSKKPL